MIYLAAPLHHTDPKIVAKRLELNRAWYEYLSVQFNQPIFSPLMHFSDVAKAAIEVHHEKIWSLDLAVLGQCSTLMLLPFDGWQQSRGVALELGFALAKGIVTQRVVVGQSSGEKQAAYYVSLQPQTLYTQHPFLEDPPK